jgi:hypothetical protein
MSISTLKSAGLALLLGASTSSCVTHRDTVAIHFSTDPPGADLYVDGVPSGFSTPCMVALKKERQVVTLVKPGYQIPVRLLFPDPVNDSWLMQEASVGPHAFKFPILIDLDDFLEPIRPMRELIPGRIFVRLKRLSDVKSEGPPTQ